MNETFYFGVNYGSPVTVEVVPAMSLCIKVTCEVVHV